MVWFSLAKSQQIYHDVRQSNIRDRGTGGCTPMSVRRCCWATTTFIASLDLSSWFQASVIVLFFSLMCRFTFFCSARSFGACTGADSNTHRRTLDVHSAGNWKQIDKYCEKKMLLHQQITQKHTHNTHESLHFTTRHRFHVSPFCHAPSSLCWFRETEYGRDMAICQHFHPTSWHHHCDTLFLHTNYRTDQRPNLCLDPVSFTWKGDLNAMKFSGKALKYFPIHKFHYYHVEFKFLHTHTRILQEMCLI